MRGLVVSRSLAVVLFCRGTRLLAVGLREATVRPASYTHGIMRLEVPDHLVDALLDAINCFSDCVEGNRLAVMDGWFLEDDRAATNGTYIGIAEHLQQMVGEPLRAEVEHRNAADPDLQEFLHRVKMDRKYGRLP